jgi:hypothetical protein
MIWQSLGKACTWQEAGCMSTVRSFCSRGGNVVEWGRGSVQAGGCGRVDGVARRGENRAGGSRVVTGPVLGLPTRSMETGMGCSFIFLRIRRSSATSLRSWPRNSQKCTSWINSSFASRWRRATTQMGRSA